VAENRVEFVDLNFFEQVPVKGKDIYYVSEKSFWRQPTKLTVTAAQKYHSRLA